LSALVLTYDDYGI